MTLSAKAARGARAPAGQATAFGRAVLRHLYAGRDINAISAALDALPSGPIIELPQAFGRLAESAIEGQAHGEMPRSDLLFSYAEAQPYSCRVEMAAGVFTLTLDLMQPATRHPSQRIKVPDGLAKQMNDLAARTLVPESKASRLSGAGAGLTDND
jgi:hypothetical protein